MFYLLLCVQLLYSSCIFTQQASLAELDQLLLSKSNAQTDREKNIVSMLPLLRNLEYKEAIDINFTLPLIKEGHSATYLPLNPSIRRADRGYDVICKATNLNIPGYQPIIQGESPRLKNFFLRYDKEFNLLHEQEMPIPSDLAKNIIEAYQVEDCRMFYWDKSHWFIGCSPIITHSYLPKVAVCKLGCNLDYCDSDSLVAIESLALFHGPKSELCEKNWMPIIEEGKLRFIYSYDPFMLLEPNLQNGTCETVLNYSPSLDFSRFRGSAAPIDFEDGYLMMVHERVLTYTYTHRFLYLDRKFRITKISLPFTFTHVGVEFCTSMVMDHSGENILMGIGIKDKEAKVLVVDFEYVKGLLIDIKSN